MARLRHDLTTTICQTITASGWTQDYAANRLGLNVNQVHELLRGALEQIGADDLVDDFVNTMTATYTGVQTACDEPLQ